MARVPGATYNSRMKKHIYVGDSLPESLVPYQSQDFSWLRWQEDNYNKSMLPLTPLPYKMTPRPHQKEAAVAIARAAAMGMRGFIEGDATGLGKTISTAFGIYGAMKMKKQRKANVLVICPKSVIEHWGNTFKALGITGGMRICVTNYDQARHLLKQPAAAKNAKRTKTKNRQTMLKGTPIVKWDYVVSDESQKLKNWDDAQIAKAFANIARYDAPSDHPFIIYSSATIGQTPTELRYLSPILWQVTKTPKSTTWRAWLEQNGFHVKVSKKSGKITWITAKDDAPPEEKQAVRDARKSDLAKINKMLFSPGSPSIRRKPQDIAGWPEIQRIAKGYALAPVEYVQYQKEWMLFRQQYRLSMRGKNPNGALAQQLRFRQKSSLIRVGNTLQEITDLLDGNFQVAVYCEFLESIDKMKEALEKKHIPVAEYTGRNEDVRESERLRFQRGQAKVIFFSVDSAVSFHAGEKLPDGSTATNTKRATLLHDVTYSGIKCSQIEGRCHRDGQFAPVYYLYAMGTTESKIAETMIGRVQSILSIMDDSRLAEELDSLLVS